jgi:hypothetical protein
MPAVNLFTIAPRTESKESDAEWTFSYDSETAGADISEGRSGRGSGVVMVMVARRRIAVMVVFSFMVDFLEFVLLASML